MDEAERRAIAEAEEAELAAAHAGDGAAADTVETSAGTAAAE